MARKRKFYSAAGPGAKRSQVEAAEIDRLDQLLDSSQLQHNTRTSAVAKTRAQLSLTAVKKFEELPISQYTLDGLQQSGFTHLTAIQRAALPLALCGRDILGAAKTGSGKTLAFLIPVLEKLYRSKWGALDGLGALVISPTRELALQIFDELRKIGKKHELSAGLLIGGKKVKEEQERVHGMNILVCTPGRLLQHMDETPGFDASQIQALVLDEADRILDMGFAATLNAILENLPRERQTMLFSATQTKSVKDLARLSLDAPEYISVHAEAAMPTPVKLQQAYVVCDLQEKVNVLWSFIKTHLKAKIIVFLSTCKQVKFMYEAFKKLRPGTPLRSLHGKMKQFKRMAVFYDFCEAKTGSVLFATDIAARGLDFPTVDWVVQADCPEDVAGYIHRVGRTARYVAEGRALLMLLPSEQEGMLKLLQEAKVPVKAIKMNPQKQQPITGALQALLSKDSALKETGQRSLVAYLRSVFLQPNHDVFDVQKLPAAEYALSLGLPTAPKLRFLKHAGRQVKHIDVGGGFQLEAQPASTPLQQADPEFPTIAQGGVPVPAPQKPGQKRSRADAELSELGGALRQDFASDSEQDDRNTGFQNKLSAKSTETGRDPAVSNSQQNIGDDSDDDNGDDDDLLVVKRRDVLDSSIDGDAPAEGIPLGAVELRGNKKKKRLRIDPGRTSGARTVFDDEGESLQPLALLAKQQLDRGEVSDAMMAALGLDVGAHLSAGDRFNQVAAVMKKRDAQDRKQQKEQRRQQKLDKKMKRKARDGAEDDMGVTLGTAEASESEEEDQLNAHTIPYGQGASESNEEDAVYEGGLSSADEAEHQQKGKPGHAAYFGMQKRRADEQAGKEYEGLSLAEQEALALRMIQR